MLKILLLATILHHAPHRDAKIPSADMKRALADVIRQDKETQKELRSVGIGKRKKQSSDFTYKLSFEESTVVFQAMSEYVDRLASIKDYPHNIIDTARKVQVKILMQYFNQAQERKTN